MSLEAWVVVGVALAIFWLWALFDAISYSDRQWKSIGSSKATWVVALAILGVFAGVAYLLVPHRALRTRSPEDEGATRPG